MHLYAPYFKRTLLLASFLTTFVAAAFAGTVTISSPTNGSTVGAPIHVVASASSSSTVSTMKIWLDGTFVYSSSGPKLDTYVPASAGQHRITVQGYDNSGSFKSTVYATVSSTTSSGCTLKSTQPSVTICTPGNNASVSSPVHVVAGSNSSPSASLMQIYLDGSKVYQVSATKLDTYVSVSSGTHRLTVQAYNGSFFKSTIYVTAGSTSSSSSTSSTSSSIPSTATTFSDIEEMSGWDSCTDCAGGGENALFSMTQNISSPSLDGDATRFWIGGSTPFSHGLWWRRMSSNTSVSHFIFDMYYYMKDPGASQGLEFAANQSKDNKWYKFSTQCSFGSAKWRVWDSANSHWVDTGITCSRPTAYKWNHVVFEYSRSDGKANFISISINGVKHYVNKSFYPQSKTSSGSVGIHFQLDGNSVQTDYSVWTDKIKLIYW